MSSPPSPSSPVPDDYTSADNALVTAALEYPMSHYLHWAERTDVAQALSLFRSEHDTRKTERLDLVTWVQYICGFGFAGPSHEAWGRLFAACRVLPMLEPNPGLLAEHEIAVLLAYAKIKPDHGDTMTATQLVKHRIKPAVLGRAVSRTPGILHHLHAKFENWALGPFADYYCNTCISGCGLSAFMPGTDEVPSALTDVGASIRACADAHANTLVKGLGTILANILDIDPDGTSQRAKRFEQVLRQKRVYMYQHIFIKMSEFYFNLTQAQADIPYDKPELDSSLYRDNPFAHHRPQSDRLIYAPHRPDNKLRVVIKKLIALPKPLRAIAPWSIVTADVTVCELHRPGRLGQAALTFIPSDNIESSMVKLKSADMNTHFTPSKTIVRIGSFNAPILTAEVHGVPPRPVCRALKLKLAVGVLSAPKGSNRPQFQIVDIEQAAWMDLDPSEDRCNECEPFTEMGMEHDEKGDELADDSLHQWFCSLGIGHLLSLGSGVHWETYDLCEGMTKHHMTVEVPSEILQRVCPDTKEHVPCDEVVSVKREGSREKVDCGSTDTTLGSFASSNMDVSMDSSAPQSETFVDTCWLDCHTGAQISYSAKPGLELYAVSPDVKNGIFNFVPYWRCRAA